MAVKKSDVEWAWEKAETISDQDPDLYRQDELGNELYKPSYGKHGEKSWEIDHRRPVNRGGTDHRKNLRILQTEANAEKGDKY